MLSPVLDPEKLKDESNLQDKEMYFLLISNFDELKSFLENLNFVNIIECFLTGVAASFSISFESWLNESYINLIIAVNPVTKGLVEFK